MVSARRQRLISRRSKNKSVLPLILKFLIPLILIAAVWLFLKEDTRYWNGSDKFAFVSEKGNGDVAVTVLDPKLSEETTLIIPGDTEVDVAGNYGTLRIKNVWQLGTNEKLGGSLLAKTVTKNFLMPVFLWSDENFKNTNIPLGDKVAMNIFLFQVKSVDKTEVDLGKSQFLKKTVLNDGSSGYVLAGPVSERITAYFADNDFADEALKVDIVDATGSPGLADTVGQIIEVLGGKVVSLERKPASDTDCTVAGTDNKIVKKIATLFGCLTSGDKSQFDLEVRLGQKFAVRF